MDIKEDIELLDAKITRLKVEYEQYFMRILKREPLVLRGEVERLIRRYSGKPITNTSFKFKYNSLVAKYNSFKYYWTRTLRAIEEGTYERRAEGGAMTSTIREPATPPDDKEDARLEEAYRRYLEARKKCNQPIEGLTLEKLKKAVEEEKNRIESRYGTRNVDIRVYINGGAAKISIVPKRE